MARLSISIDAANTSKHLQMPTAPEWRQKRKKRRNAIVGFSVNKRKFTEESRVTAGNASSSCRLISKCPRCPKPTGTPRRRPAGKPRRLSGLRRPTT